ncbi:Glycosyl transferase family 11 [Flavobacterium anhuiense]|uniref:Glycosyl transferase family 11 n=1 Tax=Flavobacterium anhuiense TaxID=459526 RepID=A0AAC9GIE7_9FLAO|nr:alpha-1,2-fucosyltransferase [Flavobacterium anhuiense]AOC95288.1 Glycosyl transferase family 11 [Flavobacterium anhuiense]
MDVIVIFNGLGNQMSQYAFYLQKKKINPSTYLISFCKDHNGLEINSIFNITWKNTLINKSLYFLFRILIADRFKLITVPLKKLLTQMGCSVINEDYDYNFNSEYLKPSKGITFYFGGWHNEKYFIDSKDEILDSFSFSKDVDEITTSLVQEMANYESVSIHVRRGDYLNAANINLFGKVCTKEYFEKAIDLMNEKVKTPHYYIFSNDIGWVKENFNLERVTYVTHNSGINSWRDMFLMSSCKHNIIANSSFSWWGAWLNKNNNNTVLSPTKFLNSDKVSDIYPANWTKISDN